MDSQSIDTAYSLARQMYGELDVDTDSVLKRLATVSVSIHCWQGDDIRGFEKSPSPLEGSGLQITGSYPGRARNANELRDDLHQALSLIPGHHRVNLHAIYGDFGQAKVDRDEIEPDHFRSWVEWSKLEGVKLDFNATCFSHPKASSGYTLSSTDHDIRKFWVDHVKACRKIAASIGREQKSFCLHNLWIPDGTKEVPVDRSLRRWLLKKSLDEIYEVNYSAQQIKDSLESKLFGIGSEAYVVGSHEFYLCYAQKNGKMICLDLGHFHPTESIADKISSILLFSDEILFHISRGIRWDSDHVVILTDTIRELAQEIVRIQALNKVHLALDYFDASLNRVGAWVLGARAVLKAFLLALLEPSEKLSVAEKEQDILQRLALEEKLKLMPAGAVWDYFCLQNNVPPSGRWLNEIENYEKNVLSKRK